MTRYDEIAWRREQDLARPKPGRHPQAPPDPAPPEPAAPKARQGPRRPPAEPRWSPARQTAVSRMMASVEPGQHWLSRSGTVIEITAVDDDLIIYERVSGPGRGRGRIRARSFMQTYQPVPEEGENDADQ